MIRKGMVFAALMAVGSILSQAMVSLFRKVGSFFLRKRFCLSYQLDVSRSRQIYNNLCCRSGLTIMLNLSPLACLNGIKCQVA